MEEADKNIRYLGIRVNLKYEKCTFAELVITFGDYYWYDFKKHSKCRLCGDNDETINHIISGNAANWHRRTRQQMVYAQPRICPRKWYTQTPVGFTNGSPNLRPKTRSYNNQQKKKRICKIVDFAVLADHRIKLE